ncbi:MAG: transposase [Bacteroidales bacterium]|nr:transposase [Bacteroidales bacterium]
MASTLVKIYIHIVFHVKNTGVPIREEDLPRIFDYIGGVIRNVGGISMVVGGMPDHIHILSTLPKTISLSDFIRTIKANTSRWIKMLDEYYAPFVWQDGYGAFSVSSTKIPAVKNYINNQKKHHETISYIDEYKQMLEAYHVPYDERYAFSD